MTPHTLWSEVLQVTEEARKEQTDVIVTLGAGSLTDAAKIVVLVSLFVFELHSLLSFPYSSSWAVTEPSTASSRPARSICKERANSYTHHPCPSRSQAKTLHHPQALANNVSTASDLETLHSGSNWHASRPDLTAPKIPIICIPTSLSGGEYTRLGGGTDDRNNRKSGFQGPSKGPSLVILDPALTTTTPDSIWLSTGIRAVDHCVEAMCSLNGTAGSDEAAARGLEALVPGLLRCKADSEDLAARLDCQLGVIDAIRAIFFVEEPLGGASHGIGHQLGPLGVGHGETSCILLPAVCKYNEKANPEQQQRVRSVLWEQEVVAEVLVRRGLSREKGGLGDVLDAIVRELGMPRSLAAVGVGEDKLDMLAENSLHDPLCATNPIPLKEKEQVMEILRMVIT